MGNSNNLKPVMVADLKALALRPDGTNGGWIISTSQKTGAGRLAIESKKTWVARHFEAAVKVDANATKSASERAFKIMRADRAHELTQQVGARMLKGEVQIAGASFNKKGIATAFKIDNPDTANADKAERVVASFDKVEDIEAFEKMILRRKAELLTQPAGGAGAESHIDTSATPVADAAAGVPEAVGATAGQ